MTKNYNLNENPSFCMLGLMHTYVSPDGNVMPCCIGDITKNPLGNINDVSSWDEIWNGEQYKTFRKNMINGIQNPICSGCFDTEKFADFSSRKLRNNQFEKWYDDYIFHLQEDGSMSTQKLKYLDFRFSNNCNQACITCGHGLSSSWYDTLVKLNRTPKEPKFIEPSNEKLAYELINSNLDSVENIYFAGGEPLLSKYHWYTIEKLIENGRACEVELVYSTNCSTLTYHGKNILEYWKQFKSVLIMASIDEVGERFNYIRWPADWNKISINLKTIADYFEEHNPRTHSLCYAPVISSLNIHRLKEMLQEFLTVGAYQKTNSTNTNFEFLFFCNLLRTPRHLSIINMPEQHWEYVENTLKDFEEWYLQDFINYSPIFDQKKDFLLRALVKIREMRKMSQKDFSFFEYDGDDYLLHLEQYSKLDEIRGTDFKKTFPELEWLYK